MWIENKQVDVGWDNIEFERGDDGRIYFIPYIEI